MPSAPTQPALQPAPISVQEECIVKTTDGATPSSPDTKRVSVVFTGEMYQVLASLASSMSKSMTEVIRDSITLEKWVQDAKAQGYRVLFERDGKVRELLLR